DLGLQTLRGQGELLLLALQPFVLALQVVDPLSENGLAGQGLAGEVLTSDLHGLLSLTGELVLLLLERVHLQFEALAAGGEIGSTAANLLQKLQLPLVRTGKGFVGVRGFVRGLGGLGTEDRPYPLEGSPP